MMVRPPQPTNWTLSDWSLEDLANSKRKHRLATRLIKHRTRSPGSVSLQEQVKAQLELFAFETW